MTSINTMDRRTFIAGAAGLSALALAGCTSTPRVTQPPAPQFDPFYVNMYGPLPNEKFPVPAVDLRYLKPEYYRQVVDDPTGERPGTIVVDTSSRYLYLVREGRQAIRYGAGIGRAGFEWSGRGYIQYKREWPTWTPPAAMIEREPHLEEWRHGQPGGLDNPLGARALYIFENGRDTIYRVHGSGEAWTIGEAVSSGCVRLLHQDVIDLYDRVSQGAPILVV
ncbi:L,D-transpeptidase [Pelagibacterium sediminicola]|uniref:L,D-transpeptidase n=1 Tax=Pelagibacterium sediminicola TaxID=2248761 RepID=UPI000E3180B4|nr:L,D-transpeptidase [Pelagibacterium sediminicola]